MALFILTIMMTHPAVASFDEDEDESESQCEILDEEGTL
jgi:hypothetical protein